MKRFADGRWHKRTDIEGALPQYSAMDIEAVLHGMCKGYYGVRAELKKTKFATYRIYKQGKRVSVHQLTEEFGPLIKQIFEATQGLNKMTSYLHPRAQDYATIIDRAIQNLKQGFEMLTK
jgi:hypothetical protein